MQDIFRLFLSIIVILAVTSCLVCALQTLHAVVFRFNVRPVVAQAQEYWGGVRKRGRRIGGRSSLANSAKLLLHPYTTTPLPKT